MVNYQALIKRLKMGSRRSMIILTLYLMVNYQALTKWLKMSSRRSMIILKPYYNGQLSGVS